MKVLIAEDDSLILRTVQMFLKKEGYDVISCSDGKDALEKFESHNPDLIITDIMLPYLSGLEITGKVKQSANSIPVIITSSMCQQSVTNEAESLGADAFIPKPYNINTLLLNISNLTRYRVAA